MLVVLKAAIAVLIVAVGMSASFEDVTYLWRRPRRLAKSLFAMYVVVPVAALLMAYALELPRGTEVALVILAICAGAPLLPRRLFKLGGDPTYVFSLVVTTSLLAILTVPLGLRLVSDYVPVDSSVTSLHVALTILRFFLVPLGIGMLIRAFSPKLAARMSEPLLEWASVALGVCAVSLLVASWRVLLTVGLETLLAFAAFTLVALVAGHALGGPEPSGRTSLAIACASRHIALAMLVAASYRGPRALALVAAYLVASVIASIPYVRWRAKVHDREVVAA